MDPKELGIPQESHGGGGDGSGGDAEAWCQPKGSSSPRKEFHTVLTSPHILQVRVELRQ